MQANAFNSTHSTNGTMNPWRQPAFNNTLGHDANVFIPDNSNFEFLPNNATDASIRVTTGGESITVQVITSVIDVYEPDLRATVFIEDINGGVAEPGDILEYTVVGKNLGSDAATAVRPQYTQHKVNQLTVTPSDWTALWQTHLQFAAGTT